METVALMIGALFSFGLGLIIEHTVLDAFIYAIVCEVMYVLVMIFQYLVGEIRCRK